MERNFATMELMLIAASRTGPRKMRLDGDRALKATHASGDTRSVVADPQARYYGAVLDAGGLTPDGANPRIGPTRFEEWLRRSVTPA